ncbi:MAG: molybdopterin dinucleotide binding domain-containing protein, partial [Synechococcus sp.]|nr:molybdopterin dinucleotide binding domain-containing protein [Synechococcus sp.]
QRLAEEGPIQWPCPANEQPPATPPDQRGLLQKLLHQGEPLKGKRLYTDGRFHTPDGRARFAAYHSRGLAEPPNTDYPFVLTIGRLYGHWHTMTRTGRIPKIQKMHPNPFLEMHPRDAARLGISEGEMVEVRSPRGMARFPALITKNITPGTVFAPMHWGALWGENTEANALSHAAACPDSLQPELKACAVNLLKITNSIPPAEAITEPVLQQL